MLLNFLSAPFPCYIPTTPPSLPPSHPHLIFIVATVSLPNVIMVSEDIGTVQVCATLTLASATASAITIGLSTVPGLMNPLIP